MAMHPVEEVGADIFQYTKNPGDQALRQQAVGLLRDYGVTGDRQSMQTLTGKLEDTCVLPQLLLSEKDKLDTDHDGRVSQSELNKILKPENSDKYDDLTKFAASYMKDLYGNPIDARIDVSPVAAGTNRRYVHLYGTDESGREHPLMRAISNDGHYSSEVDKHGNSVGVYGSWWKANNPESEFSH